MHLDTIVKIFTGIAISKIELNKDVCGTQLDKVNESKKAMLEAMGKNKELKRICEEYVKDVEKFHFDTMIEYSKEGFICGVKTILEIYGFEGIDLDKKK